MKKKRSPWPFVIAGFLTVVFTVNFTMLALAIKSDDGLTDKNYYEKGLFYDSRLKTEREAGWDIELTLKKGELAGAPDMIEVGIKSNGTPVKGASVRGVLKRPATNRFDTVFGLSEDGSSYRAEVDVLAPGYWDIEVKAEKNGKSIERVFRVKV